MYKFRIPIGDWSNDGHGKVDWFDATAKHPIDAVREAWFIACKEYPDLCPTKYCSDYQDCVLPEEIKNKLKEMGFSGIDFDDPDFDNFGLSSDNLAQIVIWFINLGDSSLEARLCTEDTIPMFPFYGFDGKNRHIDFIGYGLFY
jgi:hypothetical protein